MRLRTTVASEQLHDSSDAELAARAAKGDSPAFEELYRRHAPAAWRLAYAVACNADDAADAVSEAFTKVLTGLSAGRLDEVASFRSYLLTATRHCAIDLRRRVDRLEPTETERLDRPSMSTGPVEKVTAGIDAALVTAAFRSLPERWRSVLWLTEVEGVPAREAGARLGLSANTAAQLALRARAGLRERYLQAHLSDGVRPECKATVEKLGAYVAGRLTPRDLAKVDQHLAGCDECRARKEELEDVGTSLRRIILPLPLLLGPAAVSRFRTALTSSSASPTSTVTSSSSGASALVAKAQKPLMAVSTGLFALGVISAGVVARPRGGVQGAPRQPAAVSVTTSPPVIADRVNATFASTSTGFDSLRGIGDLELPTGGDDASASAGAGLPTQEGDGFGTMAAAPPAPAEEVAPAVKPIAQAAVAVAVGPLDAGISLGQGPGACTGGMVGGSSQGCAPAPSNASTAGITVETKGTAIGPLDGQKVNLGI